MKKIIQFVLLSVLLSSCSTYKKSESRSFASAMDKLYYEHLRYPQNAEDYLYLTYRSDSVNNYEDLCNQLNSFGLRVSDRSNPEVAKIVEYLLDSTNNYKSISYGQYNYIRALVYEKIKEVNWLDGFWGGIHMYNPLLKEGKSHLCLFDDIYKRKHCCEKIEVIFNKYMKNYKKWGGNSMHPGVSEKMYLRLVRAHEYEKTRLYRRLNDGSLVCVTNPNTPKELEDKLIEVLKHCGNSSNTTPYVLQYEKGTGVLDRSLKYEVPNEIRQNNQLIESLDDILDATNTDCVHFICITNGMGQGSINQINP